MAEDDTEQPTSPPLTYPIRGEALEMSRAGQPPKLGTYTHARPYLWLVRNRRADEPEGSDCSPPPSEPADSRLYRCLTILISIASRKRPTSETSETEAGRNSEQPPCGWF
jgi:hypothetical protein